MLQNLRQTHTLKKFYLLDYFYVLLKSVEKFSKREDVFEYFKTLKQEHLLGESKYKVLAPDDDRYSKVKENRYLYTFEGVIDEAEDYEIVKEVGRNLFLTDAGSDLIGKYERTGPLKFNQAIFALMEKRYGSFRNLIDFLYKTNEYKPGLLVFPIYSPRLLNFQKESLRTAADIIKYSRILTSKLEEDIQAHLRRNINLTIQNNKLLEELTGTGLLPANPTALYDSKEYNRIISRFRRFWLNYFLKDLYDYDGSMSTFERWVYRGKQIGIIHVTEFYPNFNGRIVYPTSILVKKAPSDDFSKLYYYPSGESLYLHTPNWASRDTQDLFVKSLVNAYFDLRRSYKSYFVSLPALRELVCYQLKISEYIFEDFLNKTYKMNLAGELSAINISLEGDKLPEETNAMYLTKEPVTVDGKHRNIIAIDIRGAKK